MWWMDKMLTFLSKKVKMFLVMKKLVFVFLLLLCFSFFAVVVRISPVRANGDPVVMIDEFVAQPSAGGEEWIELLNPDQDTALSLSGWRLVIYQGTEPNYTYFYSQDLSGSVPRGGFLTFATDNDTRIPDDGACLVIFRDESNSVYAVKYGSETCDPGADPSDATGVTIEQGKSAYYNLDEQTWNSAASPTRGWCNPGSGECPTISTITTQMTNEGVATNLGDQGDFSRISGLYFLKSEGGENIGKITFLAEMNFTDRDALTWMQSLDSKLSISQGIISLDADLIKDLTDTQASLTMYSITLNSPKILVDGQTDTGGIVSGLSYNRTTHLVTFTAAHFTTFTVAEDTGSTSTSSTSAPGCGDWPPLTAPKLFQIDTTENSATLYFMPVTDYVSYYFIAYGYKEGDWRFGTQFNSAQKIGVVNYTIKALAPSTTYYFTIRAGNGCAPGRWSNYISAKTEKLAVAKKTTSENEVLGQTTELIKEKIEQQPSPTPQITSNPEPIITPLSETKLTFWQKILSFLREIFK